MFTSFQYTLKPFPVDDLYARYECFDAEVWCCYLTVIIVWGNPVFIFSGHI